MDIWQPKPSVLLYFINWPPLLRWLLGNWREFCRSVLVSFGAIFLALESYEVLTDSNIKIEHWLFLTIGITPGIVVFILDGYCIAGFLRRKIKLSNPYNNTKITVQYGDLFMESGWKAIGVNDFFDNKVDEDLVSSNTLHGRILNTYWNGNRDDWKKQVSASLRGKSAKKESRSKGNKLRYPIGTTVRACAGEQKFLLVALGETNLANNVTSANAEMLIFAVRGMIAEARATCSMEPLVVPLMGSVLARVGIKNSVLLDLIITAILEENRQGLVTSEIKIILHKDIKSGINLKNHLRNWTHGK